MPGPVATITDLGYNYPYFFTAAERPISGINKAKSSVEVSRRQDGHHKHYAPEITAR
jgi:hypothetical protein